MRDTHQGPRANVCIDRVNHQLWLGQSRPKPGNARANRTQAAGAASVLKHRGDQEGELERLPDVEPRVAGRLVAASQICVDDFVAAAEAFGDVVTRQFDVQRRRAPCPTRDGLRRSR